MNKRIAAVVLSVALVFTSVNTFADTRNVGIGFGTNIMKGQKGKFADLVAAWANGLFANQLFSIIFGSNGYKEGLVIGYNASESYIAENMDALANDVAVGDGEYINTLASIMKVSDKVAFKATLHQNFTAIYSSPDVTPAQVNNAIKNIVG